MDALRWKQMWIVAKAVSASTTVFVAIGIVSELAGNHPKYGPLAAFGFLVGLTIGCFRADKEWKV